MSIANVIQNDENGDNSNVSAARMFKIPAFWRANPELWFKQIESQFITMRITADATRYHHVVASIEGEVLQQVSDIIISPPSINMYETLKKRIIERYSESEELRLKKLLSAIELGDQRPSHLLLEMKELASGKVSDDLLKTLWLQRLPTQVKVILAASDDTVTNLAHMADKIIEVADLKNNYGNISSTENVVTRSTTRSVETESSQFTRLEKQIAALSMKVERLTRENRTNRERSRSRGKRPTSNISRDKPKHEFCWYHFKYGDDATKCKEPCKFHSGSEN